MYPISCSTHVLCPVVIHAQPPPVPTFSIGVARLLQLISYVDILSSKDHQLHYCSLLVFYILRDLKMCNDLYPTLQCHTEQFNCFKIVYLHFSFFDPCQSFVLSLYFCLFQPSCTIIQYVAFSEQLLSLSNMHIMLPLSFSWLHNTYLFYFIILEMKSYNKHQVGLKSMATLLSQPSK